jgi:hypothetical protein
MRVSEVRQNEHTTILHAWKLGNHERLASFINVRPTYPPKSKTQSTNTTANKALLPKGILLNMLDTLNYLLLFIMPISYIT